MTATPAPTTKASTAGTANNGKKKTVVTDENHLRRILGAHTYIPHWLCIRCLRNRERSWDQ